MIVQCLNLRNRASFSLPSSLPISTQHAFTFKQTPHVETHFHCSLNLQPPPNTLFDHLTISTNNNRAVLKRPAKPAPNHNALPTQTPNNVVLRLAPLVLLPPQSNATAQFTRRAQQLLPRRVRPPQSHEHVQSLPATASGSSQ